MSHVTWRSKIGCRAPDLLTRRLSKPAPLSEMPMPTLRYLSLVCVVFFAIWAGGGSSDATNFRSDDFVELERSSVETLVPQLTKSFPQAKFLLSGFSSPKGDWKFIRVEDSRACEGDNCPTILVQSSTDWKVLVRASKEILVSIDSEGDGFVQCNLTMKGGATVSIRYLTSNKIIYVAP
jgi:hypothetical protein